MKTFSQWLKWYSYPKEVRDKAIIDIKIYNEAMSESNKAYSELNRRIKELLKQAYETTIPSN